MFMPNEATLTLRESVRINTQIILENNYTTRFKGFELVDGEGASADEEELLLSTLVREALADLPLIQPEIEVLRGNQKIPNESEISVVIGTNLTGKQEVLSSLKEDCLVLSRESLSEDVASNIEVLTTHTIVPENERLVLFRKSPQRKPKEEVINVTEDYDGFGWLKQLQTVLERSGRALLYSQTDNSGIMGLTNCLRMEPGGRNVRCVFIMDEAASFDSEDAFYQQQLSKGLAVNVFKDGRWGTFRHLPIQKDSMVTTKHCFARTVVTGDLSTVKWFEGPLNNKSIQSQCYSEKLVQVGGKQTQIC